MLSCRATFGHGLVVGVLCRVAALAVAFLRTPSRCSRPAHSLSRSLPASLLAPLLVVSTPALTGQGRLGHRQFLHSLPSMLDHRHHRPASLPCVTPVHARHKSRRRESPRLCSGRRRHARTWLGRCALLRRGSSLAVSTSWSSGAAWLPSATDRALVRLRARLPPLQPWASWPAGCGPRRA
jgi:hypothetical protein